MKLTDFKKAKLTDWHDSLNESDIQTVEPDLLESLTIASTKPVKLDKEIKDLFKSYTWGPSDPLYALLHKPNVGPSLETSREDRKRLREVAKEMLENKTLLGSKFKSMVKKFLKTLPR